MRRALNIACLAGLGLLVVDIGYWGWLLSDSPEAADLPRWQERLNAVAFFGGLALFVLVALVVLSQIGAQVVRSGSRARRARDERRELNDVLRRL